jgi:hypothetical protein
MHITLYLLIFVFGAMLLAGCSVSSQPAATSYDANSWKTMILDSCLQFFDGCNTCRRSAAGEVAACTHKACFKYQKPRCLDDVK